MPGVRITGHGERGLHIMKTIKAPKAKRLPSGSWMCRVTAQGVSRCFTGPVRADVEKLALEYKTQRQHQHITTVRVIDALAHYIDARRNVLSPATIRGYEQIKRDRFQMLHGMPISKLRDSDVQLAINMDAAQITAKSVKNAWALFASAIKAEAGLTFQVRLPQVAPPETQWLDVDQLSTFLAELRGRPCELGALLALHSLRRSELLDLTRNDIEISGDSVRIHVRGSAVIGPDGKVVHKRTNKNASSTRVVDVWLPRLAELLRQPLPDGYLVSVNPNTLYTQINKVCRDAGLPEVGVHGLRRSFASISYREGLPERVTAAIGGWADLATMHKHYVKIAERDKAQAVDQLKAFATSL